MKQNLIAVLALFVLALAVRADDSSPVQAESSAQRSGAANTHRFDVVSRNPVEHGARLSAVLGCIGCHKLDLTGEDWSDPDLGVLWTANLTHSAADYSAEQLIAMITEGKRPDRALLDMPSYLFSELHPDDLAALVAYLKTLPRKGVKHPEATIGPQLAKDIASGEFKNSVQWVADMKNTAPPDLGPDHAFARAILRATCAECHGMNLEGDTEQLMDAPPRPSLRVIAAYSEKDFSTLMKTGKAVGNRDLKLMGGVARWRYSQFTENELKAIYDYLVALSKQPPIK